MYINFLLNGHLYLNRTFVKKKYPMQTDIPINDYKNLCNYQWYFDVKKYMSCKMFFVLQKLAKFLLKKKKGKETAPQGNFVFFRKIR